MRWTALILLRFQLKQLDVGGPCPTNSTLEVSRRPAFSKPGEQWQQVKRQTPGPDGTAEVIVFGRLDLE